jgi:hypothetical protein
MRLKIYFCAITLALICACHREQPPQYIAGFISEIESEQLIAIDSMGSGIIHSFTIDENTQYQSSGLIEGNVAEVMYIPTEEEQTPTAISITTDDTYPKVLGRWSTLDGEKMPIEIELLTRGKIRQHTPEAILEYTSWQLLAKEDTIRLIGRLSLPPIVEKDKKKEKDKESEEVQPAPRREQAFTTIAVVGTEGDRRTLTLITNKGTKSTLYKKE